MRERAIQSATARSDRKTLTRRESEMNPSRRLVAGFRTLPAGTPPIRSLRSWRNSGGSARRCASRPRISPRVPPARGTAHDRTATSAGSAGGHPTTTTAGSHRRDVRRGARTRATGRLRAEGQGVAAKRGNSDRSPLHLVERQHIREPLGIGDAPVDVEMLKCGPLVQAWCSDVARRTAPLHAPLDGSSPQRRTPVPPSRAFRAEQGDRYRPWVAYEGPDRRNGPGRHPSAAERRHRQRPAPPAVLADRARTLRRAQLPSGALWTGQRSRGRSARRPTGMPPTVNEPGAVVPQQPQGASGDRPRRRDGRRPFVRVRPSPVPRRIITVESR